VLGRKKKNEVMKEKKDRRPAIEKVPEGKAQEEKKWE